MTYKILSIPPRIGGNFLDQPIEKGQVSLQFYKMFEQISDNFSNNFDLNGNLILTEGIRPNNPIKNVTIIDNVLGIPIFFDGTNWKNYLGTVV